MKVLFVCRGNVGSSQAAMEIYNANASTLSESAGTQVEDEAKIVGDRVGANSIVSAIEEEGLDISRNTSRQITPAMVDEFDKVIVMAELSAVPRWLQDSPKTELWNIPDLKDVSLEEARSTLSLIKEKVAELKSRS